MRIDVSCNKGVTLVELLAAGAIGLLVMASVVSFVVLSANTAERIVARSIIRNDAAVFTRAFKSVVSSGHHIQPAGGFKGAVSAVETQAIESVDIKDSVRGRMEIRDDTLFVNDRNIPLTTLKGGKVNTGFRVYPTSREANAWYTFAAYGRIRNTVIDSLRDSISGVWCRN